MVNIAPNGFRHKTSGNFLEIYYTISKSMGGFWDVVRVDVIITTQNGVVPYYDGE